MSLVSELERPYQQSNEIIIFDFYPEQSKMENKVAFVSVNLKSSLFSSCKLVDIKFTFM